MKNTLSILAGWALFVTVSVVTVALIVLAAALLTSCGPECAPAYSTVGNHDGEPGHYRFHATNRLTSGARLETSRPWLVDEIDQVVSDTLECAAAIGPTLTDEEGDYDKGACIYHMARNWWCDVESCLKIKIVERNYHVSRIDGVTLLLNDEAGDADSCHPKPNMDPKEPFYWPAGCQQDGVCVAPPPSGEFFDAEGAYGRWGGLRRAIVDYVLGCYNSPLVDRLQPCLTGMVVDVTE